MRPDRIVVGAGCAGLAAATRLAELGARVRVVEARRVAGGRSRSWLDPATGDVEDNGQHLVMGCYEEFLAFARRTGGIDELRFQDRPRIVLVERGGRRVVFAPGPLPRPLDLLWGLVCLRGFPAGSVWHARGILRDLRRGGPAGADLTASSWLAARRQAEEARRRFWDPLILATTNLDPDRVPASLLAEVLRRALLGGRDAARIGYPRRGLGPLVVDPARSYLESHGGQLTLGAPVAAIEWNGDGRFRALVLRDGRRLEAGGLILAVPHREAAGLLAAGPASRCVEDGQRLGASAIVATHLWFDRCVSPEPVAGLIDSPVHWVFNRARIGGAREPGYLALVTSAAGRLAASSRSEIVALALGELAAFFPAAREARLVKARVIKERRATPAFEPGTLALRPEARTRSPNLFLAGDWTATGLPATLEGAAASGHRAAEQSVA